MRTGSFSAAGLLALVSLVGSAACGSDVETTPGSGSNSTGTGNGGAGAQSSTTSTMDGMCDGDPCCAPGAHGAECCNTACCPSSVGCNTGGSGGAGSICGGKQGIPCASNQYCDYDNDQCGNADNTGTCVIKPLDCPMGEPDPTCACDGMTYPSACLANLAGFDVNNSGGCPAPGGSFSCGKTFCTTGQEYCVRSVSDVGGTPDSYGCKALPPACVMATPPSCDCLKAEPCGDICDVTAPGGLQLTCPGG